MEEAGLQVDRRCNSGKSPGCTHGLCREEGSCHEGTKVGANCIFQYLMGSYREKRPRLFSGENSKITGTNSHRLNKRNSKFQVSVLVRLSQQWNSCPEQLESLCSWKLKNP